VEGVEIIDNFLPEGVHRTLHNLVFEGVIPLKLEETTLGYGGLGKDSRLNKIHSIKEEGHSFFCNMMYKDHGWWSEEARVAGMPLISQIDPLALIRVKLNVYTNRGHAVSSGWHYDISDKYSVHHTAVYYLNTNNGYTLLEDGTKVSSVANRLLVFPGRTKHTGITQTDEEVRAFVSLNYIKS
jgi:hypothetical protein